MIPVARQGPPSTNNLTSPSFRVGANEPNAFTQTPRAIPLYKRKNVKLSTFVDDSLGGDSSCEGAWTKFESAVEFFLDCGVAVSIKSSGLVPPSQETVWTGWMIHTVKKMIIAEEKKCSTASNQIKEILTLDKNKNLRAKTLASNQGLLVHLSVTSRFKRRTHNVWGVLNVSGVYQAWQRGSTANPKVRLTEEAKNDLGWWLEMLSKPQERMWRPIMQKGQALTTWTVDSPSYKNIVENNYVPDDSSLDVYEVDAAGGDERSWGYIDSQSSTVYNGEWPDEMVSVMVLSPPKRKRNASVRMKKGRVVSYKLVKAKDTAINWKELYTMKMILQRLRDEGADVKGRRILVKSDNECAVHYANHRYGDFEHLEALSAEIDVLEQELGVGLLAVHIPGQDNVVADLASRQRDFSRAWNNDKLLHASFTEKSFSRIKQLVGEKFYMTAFSSGSEDSASRASVVQRTPRNSAFNFDLATVPKKEAIWAFPPKAVTQEWLKKVSREKPKAKILTAIQLDPMAPFMRSKIMGDFESVLSWPARSRLFVIPGHHDVQSAPFDIHILKYRKDSKKPSGSIKKPKKANCLRKTSHESS